jgi:hypothetical protein
MNIMKQQETTLVQRACAKVAGFKALHKRLEKKIIVSGKSLSTLNNYMRCIAHVALHFNCLPQELDIEQIEEYLLSVIACLFHSRSLPNRTRIPFNPHSIKPHSHRYRRFGATEASCWAVPAT